MIDYGDCNRCPKLKLIRLDAMDVIEEKNGVEAMFNAGELTSDDDTLKRAGHKLERLHEEWAAITAFRDAALLCKGVVTAEVVDDGDRFEITVCRQPIASTGPAAAFITRSAVQPAD